MASPIPLESVAAGLARVAVAVGDPIKVSELLPDLAAREVPNARKSQREFVFPGRYAPGA